MDSVRRLGIRMLLSFRRLPPIQLSKGLAYTHLYHARTGH